METKHLTEIAILVALAVVLEVIFTGLAAFMPFLELPYGGRITLSMLPLFVITYRHGFKYGIIGGVIYSVLNLLLDAELWHWGSLFLDYGFAFGALGLGYLGVMLLGKNRLGFSFMVVIGFLFRYFFHWLSGWILFAEYMPEDFTNVYWYSLVYNAYYIFPSMLLVLVVGLLLFSRFENLKLFNT